MDDDKYELTQMLRTTGFGNVYIAKHRQSKKDYAIKAARKVDQDGKDLTPMAKNERDVSFLDHDFVLCSAAQACKCIKDSKLKNPECFNLK